MKVKIFGRGAACQTAAAPRVGGVGTEVPGRSPGGDRAQTKSGQKPADVRPLVHDLRLAPEPAGANDAAAGQPHAVVQAGSSGANLRPADLKDTHRTGLFRRDEQGSLLTPWEW